MNRQFRNHVIQTITFCRIPFFKSLNSEFDDSQPGNGTNATHRTSELRTTENTDSMELAGLHIQTLEVATNGETTPITSELRKASGSEEFV